MEEEEEEKYEEGSLFSIDIFMIIIKRMMRMIEYM